MTAQGPPNSSRSVRPPHTDPRAPSAPSLGRFALGARRSARPLSQIPPEPQAKSTPRRRERGRLSNHPAPANLPQTRGSKGRSQVRTATRPTKQQYGGSSHRLFHPARLSLLAHNHSTALPSPKRYD